MLPQKYSEETEMPSQYSIVHSYNQTPLSPINTASAKSKQSQQFITQEAMENWTVLVNQTVTF